MPSLHSQNQGNYKLFFFSGCVFLEERKVYILFWIHIQRIQNARLFDVSLNDSHESINQIDTSKLLSQIQKNRIFWGLSYKPVEMDLAWSVSGVHMCV